MVYTHINTDIHYSKSDSYNAMSTRGRGRGGRGRAGKLKLYVKPTSESQSPRSNISTVAAELRDLATQIQYDAYQRGRRFNQLIRQIDPQYEDVIIGHAHRAAGMLIYRMEGREVEILMGHFDIGTKNPRFGKIEVKSLPPPAEATEVQVLGGKAQGMEYPLETAIREVGEETLQCIPKNALEALYNRPQVSHVMTSGRYTLFFVEAKALGIDPKGILDDYKAARHKFDHGDAKTGKASGDFRPPHWLTWLKLSSLDTPSIASLLSPFAIDILREPAVTAFFKEKVATPSAPVAPMYTFQMPPEMASVMGFTPFAYPAPRENQLNNTTPATAPLSLTGISNTPLGLTGISNTPKAE